MTARARLDADRTAVPLTRIEHHPPHGGCVSPYMPLVAPEYVGANGERVPLISPAEAPPALTPSEVALAKVLAAWEEWPGPNGSPGDIDEALGDVGDRLAAVDMFDHGRLTEAGRALLDRARKAGVL